MVMCTTGDEPGTECVTTAKLDGERTSASTACSAKDGAFWSDVTSRIGVSLQQGRHSRHPLPSRPPHSLQACPWSIRSVSNAVIIPVITVKTEEMPHKNRILLVFPLRLLCHKQCHSSVITCLR